MKLTYARALVGFCPDLTDPNAKSLPVATLVVGEADDDRLAAAVCLIPNGLELDELSRAMLSDVPALLRRHVDRVLESLPPDAPIEQILYSLHDALRNSLHVIDVGERTTVELGPSVYHDLLDIALNDLQGALRGVGINVVFAPPWGAGATPPPPRPSKRPEATSTAVHRLPDTGIWPLRRDGMQSAHT